MPLARSRSPGSARPRRGCWRRRRRSALGRAPRWLIQKIVQTPLKARDRKIVAFGFLVEAIGADRARRVAVAVGLVAQPGHQREREGEHGREDRRPGERADQLVRQSRDHEGDRERQAVRGLDDLGDHDRRDDELGPRVVRLLDLARL